MKSNNVRMKINRDLHAQFKRVDGDSNDGRMSKLLTDSKEKYQLIRDVSLYKMGTESIARAYDVEQIKTRSLTSALVISVIVSVCSVAYVCVVNGWFS